MTKNPRISVVGGGISGLAAANRILEQCRKRSLPIEVRVLEARGQAGGTIETSLRQGCVLEGGPDAFISEKPWALDLCRRIGLEKRLIGTNPERRRTFIAWRGKLHPLPEGFVLLAPTRLWPMATSSLFSLQGKLRMGLDLVLPRGRADRDESLASFVRRRLGREALERVAQPMVGGIHAADPETLSLRATMPRFIEMEKKYRSIIRAMMAAGRKQAAADRSSGARYGIFVTLDGGMGLLIDTLVERIGKSRIEVDAEAKSVRAVDGGGWRIERGDGRTEETDALLLAVPSNRAASMLRAADPEIACLLAGVPYNSSATVNLAYKLDDVPRPLDGFGFVVPAVERRAIMACTFCHVKFQGRAPEGWALLRCFIGGAFNPGLLELSDEEIERASRAELRTFLGIQKPPIFCDVRRYPLSMPNYLVGHLDHAAAINRAASRWKGLALTGSAYEGVGIPDCIRAAEEAADRLVKEVAERDD